MLTKNGLKKIKVYCTTISVPFWMKSGILFIYGTDQKALKKNLKKDIVY
jgi:hypothetical protein